MLIKQEDAIVNDWRDVDKLTVEMLGVKSNLRRIDDVLGAMARLLEHHGVV